MATPYELIEQAYQASMGQVENRRKQGEADRAVKADRLQKNLTEQQRGVNMIYNTAVNPFGRNQEQRGVMGTGVSDYYRNAALGNMLQGLGQAERGYQDSMSIVDRDWQDYLLELAGMENEAQRTRASAIDERQRYDAEQERLRLQAEEDKRRYDQEWQRQLAIDELNRRKAASGGGTGGYDLSGTPKDVTPTNMSIGNPVSLYGSYTSPSRTPSSPSKTRPNVTSLYGSYTAPKKYTPRSAVYK